MTRAVQTQVKTNQALQKGLSDRKQGVCVGIDWPSGSASVSVGGSLPVDMPMAGVPPIVNARCWVGFLGRAPICLGPVARPPFGTVSGAPSGGLVAVTGDDGEMYTVTYPSGFTPTSAQRVLLDWTSGGAILHQPAADPNTGDANPLPVIPTGGAQTRTFNPIASGTWNSGSGFHRSDVWCSSTETGVWIYEGIAASIPDTANITGVVVHVDEYFNEFPSSLATIGMHHLSSLSGTPNVVSAVTVPAGSGDKALPLSFGDALKTGAQLGLGTAHGGYHKWSAAGVNNSGALTISWT